jgi:hypothetical protein
VIALLFGIMLGVAVTVVVVEISGGWYTYEIRPSYRCTIESGASEYLGVSEPVAGFPCVLRTPRFHIP